MPLFSKQKKPLTAADEARIVDAIQRAELHNRGEVRVHVDAQPHNEDPLHRAARLHRGLGMDKTEDQTGVLLYVSLGTRKAAVFAGPGIHGATTATFWQGVTDALALGAKEGDLPAGIECALALVGDLLRQHAPGEDALGNELPDAVTTDGVPRSPTASG